jgi:hypothetical protein
MVFMVISLVWGVRAAHIKLARVTREQHGSPMGEPAMGGYNISGSRAPVPAKSASENGF